MEVPSKIELPSESTKAIVGGQELHADFFQWGITGGIGSNSLSVRT